MKTLRIASALVIVVLVGLGMWRATAPKPSGFFDARPDYNTTGGQPMRPRWME